MLSAWRALSIAICAHSGDHVAHLALQPARDFVGQVRDALFWVLQRDVVANRKVPARGARRMGENRRQGRSRPFGSEANRLERGLTLACSYR